MPLSLLPATVLKQKTGFHHWPWRRNQNVEGGPLVERALHGGLGSGNPFLLRNRLPTAAPRREFTTLLGLDRSVDRGACAVCKIYQDQVAGRPLFTSGFLRGDGGADPRRPARGWPRRNGWCW